MDPIFQEESARLSWTKEQYLQAAEDERLMLSALPRLYPNDPNLLNELLLHTHNRIVRLEQSRRKPYFARIDFTDGSSAQTDRCYIGKIGVADQDGQIITVDWRAPVATLYYDSNLGKASYQAPEGAICGTLSLKRQYEIEEGTLLSYHDVDSVSNDELLKPFLSTGADSRLKNIVASIQTEQNRIIREDLHKNLIVQGAAGSGKTTVALHRIAYLVYRWRDSIRPASTWSSAQTCFSSATSQRFCRIWMWTVYRSSPMQHWPPSIWEKILPCKTLLKRWLLLWSRGWIRRYSAIKAPLTTGMHWIGFCQILKTLCCRKGRSPRLAFCC